MDIIKDLQGEVKAAVKSVFDFEMPEEQVIINPTKKEFEGAYTFVVFPLVKKLSKSPLDLANAIGEELLSKSDRIIAFNVIKGFLNFSLSSQVWNALLSDISSDPNFGNKESNGKKMMVEFSSPNTNKPLHLGHIRNILLGWSMSKIAEANGCEVIKTKVVNDRGIAVCKSMLAWQKTANGKTPESENVKGDHFVGQYYVAFEKLFQEEYKKWQSSEKALEVFGSSKKEEETKDSFFKRYKNKYFNNYSDIGKEAKDMLLRWEAGDEETISLWKKMNGWVYDGFNITYDKLGVQFDEITYESDTYLLGKQAVENGLESGMFYSKPDSSVWIDLEAEGMDHKLVLRSDGTSVYMTQDLGTAQVRFKKYGIDSMIYVVGDEQDYHFQVLFKILKRMGEPYADGLYHLSYGMVDLPTGKMKSREGTVVDADDLIADVIEEAKSSAMERGGLEGIDDKEKSEVFRKVGMSALKYFMIKVSPKKRMTFNPKESVDMQGTTGPYIQNAFVRISSIMRKLEGDVKYESGYDDIADLEKEILITLNTYPEVLSEALQKYDPSVVANYCYSLAKMYHRFYHDFRILTAETENAKQFRLTLSQSVGKVLKHGMDLLGIEMPEYM